MSARQFVRRTLRAVVPFVVVAAAACAEPVAPPQAPELRLTASTEGAVAPAAVFADAPTGALFSRPVVKFAKWAPALSTYDTSFTVVVGTASTHLINYKGSAVPFLKLEIPTSATFFDANGHALSAGTVVAVRTQVDPVNAAVRFGPHGTQFSERQPAKVSLNYYALDLGGVRADQLGIWYQPDDATTWVPQTTRLDTSFWWLTASIPHFSNYAISY